MEKEYKYCLRCGRVLKNPVTRKLGYGPICHKKMLAGSCIKKLFIPK